MNMNISTYIDAMNAIRQIAEDYPVYLNMDLDTIQDAGGVNSDTVFCGYLWHEVEVVFLEMDEHTNELLADAMMDFFLGMWED